MINCWISDSESPVVTEINLDAVEKNGNESIRTGWGRTANGYDALCPIRTVSCVTVSSSRKVIITRSSTRKMEAARSRRHPSLSSTLKRGTFAATASR